MAIVRAARKEEVPPGSIREFQLDGKTIALANVDGKFYAINNTCLHRGGP
ncbi:MAG: Rieske (2Fe-2S) protein, partial [Candidatus Acidiferrales bacterium]